MAEKKKNYSELSAELAEIIAWFESDGVELDSAITKYEQAMKLIGQIENYLRTAENKIQKITLSQTE
jgi:exodeoxyribonuclease VII small subunit